LFVCLKRVVARNYHVLFIYPPGSTELASCFWSEYYKEGF